VIVLSNNIKILLVSFVHHIELQNFLNAPRMFEAVNLCERQTHVPTMGSFASSGLGGSANHSLRDVGMAEPSKEVERPTASQGINRKSMEANRKSHLELPVPQKPHNVAQTWGSDVRDSSEPNSRANYDSLALNAPDANSFVQHGAWKSENLLSTGFNKRTSRSTGTLFGSSTSIG